jgi:hypothetical protein
VLACALYAQLCVYAVFLAFHFRGRAKGVNARYDHLYRVKGLLVYLVPFVAGAKKLRQVKLVYYGCGLVIVFDRASIA